MKRLFACLFIVIFTLSCKDTSDDCVANVDDLIDKGYNQWGMLSAYHYNVGDTIIFFSINDDKSIQEKVIFIPKNDSLKDFFVRKGYVELLQADSNKVYLFHNRTNKLFRIDSMKTKISLKQFCNCFKSSVDI